MTSPGWTMALAPSCSLALSGQKLADERREPLGSLLHQEVAGLRQELEAHRPRDVAVQPLSPLGSEVGVVGGPDKQRRAVEASQAGEQIHGGPVVLRVELACEEALGLLSAATVAQVGPDVPVQELRRQRPRVV